MVDPPPPPGTIGPAPPMPPVVALPLGRPGALPVDEHANAKRRRVAPTVRAARIATLVNVVTYVPDPSIVAPLWVHFVDFGITFLLSNMILSER